MKQEEAGWVIAVGAALVVPWKGTPDPEVSAGIVSECPIVIRVNPPENPDHSCLLR
ncbi:MAG TPA: hypothetical protein HA256_00855 [Methanoregulaceae archaeon]|jgi:hypothetical protein|nr:hypothetical protein [Methanoregulaceae archaeon]